MSAEPLYIQLTWEDPETGEIKCPRLSAPIAIGRELDQMPEQIAEQLVSRLKLEHKQVSRFHALITLSNYQLYVTDRSANGTYLNGRPLSQGSQPFSSQDTLRIGPYKITAVLTHGQDPDSSTELTTYESLAGNAAIAPLHRNTLLVWLIGLGVLIVMGASSWFVFSLLLERSRPQLPAEQSSMSQPFGNPL